MRRALCEFLPQQIDQSIELSETESRHLMTVLRLSPEDEIELMDGHGKSATARMAYRGKKLFATLITEPKSDPARLGKNIQLFMAMLKAEAMEWVVEKAVELGVQTLTPVETEFSVVRVKDKSPFQERYQKIADQALKQCGRLDRLKIEAPITFEQVFLNCHHLICLDESLASTALSEYHLASVLRKNSEFQLRTLLIGPEGGFSAKEKQRLVHLTTLGKGAITRVHVGSLILRAETAALVSLALVSNLEPENA